MSVKITDNKITMTRGDTLRVAVSMTRNGEPYTPVSGDAVRFAMKNKRMTTGGKEYYDDEPILIKPIPIATMVLELESDDTKQFDFGTYCYDIQITFADGTVDTFIEPQLDSSRNPIPNFILTPEVE